MTEVRVFLKPQSPLTHRPAPRHWHLGQGEQLNLERHLVRRNAEFTFCLWKLIPEDEPEKPMQFSLLALFRKDNAKEKQISALFLLSPAASKSQPTKSSLRTEHSSEKPV